MEARLAPEVIIVRHNSRRFAWLIPCLFAGAAGSHPAQAQTPLTAINNPQGGKIVYGLVDGATTQAGAMSSVLRVVHNNCGEKPQVGTLFRVRGTNSVAVFFGVVNHPQGNKKVAGMLIASPSGPNRVEAALVSDDAARFGSTVNPMLTKLFSVWHPGGGTVQPSGPATGGGAAPPAPLHRVAGQDNSASAAIPDGWTFKANGGTAMVNAPNNEVIISLNLSRGATNPPRYPNAPGTYGKIIYPSNADPIRAFPEIIRQLFKLSGTTIDFRVAHAEQVQAPPGQRCVHGIGLGVLGAQGVAEKDMPEMEALLCTSAPGPMGGYGVSLSMSEIMAGHGDKWRATVGAIFSSFQVNQAVVAQEANAMAAPAINAIHAIGQAATARAAAASEAHDIQNQSWAARQDSLDKRNQAFSNYLLDQTVIQDNYLNAHGTVWNDTANALVKANPNRWEIVDTPNFWKGVDY